MGNEIRVMIIDEDDPFRQDLAAMLAPVKMTVVASSGYGIAAVSLAEETKPDVILAAVEEPVARAVQTIQAVRGVLPAAPVIAYSSATDLAIVRQVMQAGARDLLAQPLRPTEVVSAIELSVRGYTGAAHAEGAAVPKAAGTVVTVFGAKGGIGKTTITTNLAVAIARDTDSSVLVIDLDTRFGDVAIMMDVEPKFTVAEVASNLKTLDREGFKSTLIQHSSGVYILPSPKHPNDWRSVTVDQVRELVRFASRIFDFVVLDTPGAFNEIVGAAIEVATQVVIVTSVDMASIKDTAYVLDLLEKQNFPGERLLLTVNHPNGANTIRSGDIARVLRKEVYWEIPHDNEVSVAAQVGQPVVLSRPKCRSSSSIAGLAAKIAGRGTAPAAKQGLFRRLIPSGGKN